MESEPEISVDDLEAFRDKTRMTILNTLNKRRYTISELSKILHLSKPTILYHTKILEDAGYIQRLEDGRKWIYYELTKQGKSALRWRRIKVILPLITATAAVIAIIATLLTKRREEVPEYPVMGADFTWLYISVLTIIFLASIAFIVYIYKTEK